MLIQIFQQYQPNFFSIPVIAVSTLTLVVGLFIVFQNIKSPVNSSFFLICLAVSTWLYGAGFLLGVEDRVLGVKIYRSMTFLGVSFIATTIYAFSVAWFKLFDKQKFWVIAGFLGSTIFYVVSRFTSYGVYAVEEFFWGLYPRYGISNQIFLLLFFGYFFAAFYNFFTKHFQETDRVRKKQIRIIAFAFLIAFTGSVDYIPKIIPIQLYPWGYLSVFVWILMVAYSIVRYHAMNIETVVHKTIMWFATTAITILPFMFFIHLTQDWMRTLPHMFANFYATFVAVLFYLYFQAIQPRLTQLFMRRHANLEAARIRFSQTLARLKNLRDLLQRFVRMLRRTVYAKKVSIYLFDEKTNQYVPAIAKGSRGLKPIAKDSPFLDWLKHKNRVVIGDLALSDPRVASFRDEMKQYFDHVGAVVTVPFVASGKLIGLFNLGKKENLGRYTREEIYFLQQIKSPVTVAFSNSTQFENISRLYKHVQHQNERLKELDRLKSQLIQNTSHELRTPLNGILGLVESILDGADGEVNDKQKRHLKMIIDSGTNLKELINNFLELSRIESGQAKVEVKEFDLVKTIDAVLAIMEGIATQKNIKVRKDTPKVLPSVYGDSEKIQRVLINLVGNAVKFTEKGEVVIRVEDREGDVRISVKDTGIGISEKDVQVIFDRFRQADGSATREYEGTGLGLSIAREIVVLHQSDIDVKSTINEGSEFSFNLSKQPFEAPQKVEEDSPDEEQLPALGDKETADTVQAEAKPAEESKQDVFEEQVQDVMHEVDKDPEYEEVVQGHGEMILVVDDNPVNREVVKTRLNFHNYKVKEAVDGLDALEKIKEEIPDLIILDLMMPRMSGYEFCEKIRENHDADQVPIIMLTAKTDTSDIIYGFRIGANDYVPKPFHQEELMARVGAFLKIRKLSDELREWNAELENRVEQRSKELEQTQKQLIQAEKLATVGTLAGGVAHEINNPLTAVLTNSQILKMTITEQDDLEMIDLIEQGAKRCQGIVKKLMKYARKSPEDGKIQEIDIKNVVNNVLSMFSYQIKQQNVDVQCEIPEVPVIKGVTNELEQVFTNLLLNARDAILSTGRQDGQIKIQGARQNGYIQVDVADNGKGIPEKNLNQIFDPFFTTKDVGKGTGLGLAVTYSILEKHNCKVHVESKVGQGTTFVLRFPVMQTSEPESEDKEATAKS